MHMKSLYKHTTLYTALFVFAALCAGGRVAHASIDTFCSDIDTIQATVEAKKEAHMDTYRALQEKHEERFSENKKNFIVLKTAYQSRKVTPAFTESTKRGEIARVEAMQARLDQAQAFFGEQRSVMSVTLETVARLEKEAFEEARDACESGVSDEEVANAFKTDMKEIQTLIQTRGQEIREKKEQAEVFQNNSTRGPRTGGTLFFNSSFFRN